VDGACKTFRVYVRDPAAGQTRMFPTSAHSERLADEMGRRGFAGPFACDKELAALEVTIEPMDCEDQRR
jgi:hypothetical protein